MPYKDPERKRLYELALRQANPERWRELNRRYREEHKEEIREQRKGYAATHRDKRRAYIRQWYRQKFTTPQGYIEHRLRLLTYRAVNGTANENSVVAELGCSMADFRKHFERQFCPGMDWSNHNRHGWHIDHITPCSAFDLTDSEQRRRCFHFSNLRPLWASENLAKGKRRIG